MPDGHRAHAVAAETAAYAPDGQPVQAGSVAALNCPGLHAAHDVAVVAPRADEAEPGSHPLHEVEASQEA